MPRGNSLERYLSCPLSSRNAKCTCQHLAGTRSGSSALAVHDLLIDLYLPPVELSITVVEKRSVRRRVYTHRIPGTRECPMLHAVMLRSSIQRVSKSSAFSWHVGPRRSHPHEMRGKSYSGEPTGKNPVLSRKEKRIKDLAHVVLNALFLSMTIPKAHNICELLMLEH